MADDSADAAKQRDVVLLDRIEPGVTPPYCIHGRATCVGCDEWVWLGDRTYGAVTVGGAAPLCLVCAAKFVPKGQRPKGHIDDHRRADGPHRPIAEGRST